jgi:hypothetical protein
MNMTKVIETETVRVTASPIITLKGRGKQAREIAYIQIAPLSFVEHLSRADSISNLQAALGRSPTEAEVKAAQTEYTIGAVASRLPAGEFPKGMNPDDDSAKLEFARALVCSYAAPPQPGKKARELRKGQLGRRSVMQQRVVRAADERWSLIKAELGLGNARTMAEKNAKAKRATNANPKRGDGKADSATLMQLATPAAPVSSVDYVQHMQTQIAALVAYDKKHAAKRPTTHGEFSEALIALGKIGNAAANTFQARQDAATGK